VPSNSNTVAATQKMDIIVGNLLRAGVALSAAVVFVGGVIYLVRHGAETRNYHIFRGEPADLSALSGIVRNALAFRARGIIQLGLVLLIATPVARVAFLIYAFGRQGDRLYAVIASIVLALLVYGPLN
jgi:uncharacterized membrane protein